MVLRWAAALLMTEHNSRRMLGCRDQWMLTVALDRSEVLVEEGVS